MLTNLIDSRYPVLCAPFVTSCEAMEFADRGEERPDRTVSLLMVLHALRLVREVDGVDRFLPSLMLLLFEPRK